MTEQIECTPSSLFSWSYVLRGAYHRAETRLGWGGERGELEIDGVRHRIRKQGILSGEWTLERHGEPIATARKPSAFTRVFLINDPDAWKLRPACPLTRSFDVERSGQTAATIEPNHVFTRRATITVHQQDLDFTTVAFAFWLSSLMWRRAASSAGANT